MHLLVVDGFLSLLLSFLEPIRHPVAGNGLGSRCGSRREGCRDTRGSCCGCFGPVQSSSLCVRKRRLHRLGRNGGERLAGLAALRLEVHVGRTRQRGLLHLDKILGQVGGQASAYRLARERGNGGLSGRQAGGLALGSKLGRFHVGSRIDDLHSLGHEAGCTSSLLAMDGSPFGARGQLGLAHPPAAHPTRHVKQHGDA